MSRPRRGDPFVAGRLQVWRRAAGLTQVQLAAKLGIPHERMSAIEACHQGLRTYLLQRLAALGLDLHWLLLGTGPMRRPTGDGAAEG